MNKNKRMIGIALCGAALTLSVLAEEAATTPTVANPPVSAEKKINGCKELFLHGHAARV